MLVENQKLLSAPSILGDPVEDTGSSLVNNVEKPKTQIPKMAVNDK